VPSYSQKAAAIGSEGNARAGTFNPAPQAGRRTSIFIVTSPRPQVGKTFIARLLIDFLRLQGGVPMAFDLNPDGDALRDYLPALAIAAEVDDTAGQMALFDRLIFNDGTPKVVDNEAIVKDRNLRGKFPFTRTATVPLQITALAPMLKAQIETSGCSFADVHDELPLKIPLDLAYELSAWTRRTFVEFRELELRLLLEQLRASMENPLVGE
jgi:hypothetical protein